MTLLDVLRQARATPKTVLFRLMLDYRSDGGTVHAFFEGQDDESFFVGVLAQHCPQPYRLFLYRCNGKGGVFGVRGGVDPARVDFARLMFFVDRDFADIIPEQWPSGDDVYVTDGYSIENDVSTVHTLERYLRDILHLDASVDDERALIEHFLRQQDLLYRRLLVISAWLVYVRRLGLRPNVSNIDLAKIVRVSPELEVQRVRSESSLSSYLAQVTGVTVPPDSWKGIRAVARELIADFQPKQYTRGKFELWHFVEFAMRVATLLNRPDVRGQQRVVVRTQLNHANAVEILGPRTRTPHSLRQFCERRFGDLPPFAQAV